MLGDLVIAKFGYRKVGAKGVLSWPQRVFGHGLKPIGSSMVACSSWQALVPRGKHAVAECIATMYHSKRK